MSTAFLIGASLALAVGIMATWVGFDRDRAFYPAVMIVIASYYVLFAVMGGSSHSLLMECAVMAAFLIASIAGFKRTPWLLVAALAGHGVLDLVHPQLISNAGVPVWWPNFCLAYDLVAAGYLATLLIRARFPVVSRRGNQGTRPHPVLGGSEPLDPQGASR